MGQVDNKEIKAALQPIKDLEKKVRGLNEVYNGGLDNDTITAVLLEIKTIKEGCLVEFLNTQ
tara:strand:- start:588 stop:773 length:186 start_codon:yes stop_codon:yes gene_type:complete